MLPFLRSGDILFLRKIKFQQVKINDLIMVKKGTNIFSHRVIYKNVSYLITKGDNNPQSDGKILPKQMIWKVYQIKRNGHIINLENFYLLQSTLYFQEIVKVKKAFEKEKIDFVFLKGLPLHLYFEKSHPRRMYADCDLLIAEKDYLQAKSALIRMGYKQQESAYTPLHKILKDKQTEISFYRLNKGFPIVFDIHFEPVFLMNQLGKLNALYPEKFMHQMTRDFLQTKRTIKVQGEQFYVLDTSYLILYLALHFFHHNFRGAYRLEMIDRVMRKTIQIPSPRGSTSGRTVWCTPSHTFQVFNSLSRKIVAYKVQNFVYPVFWFLKKYYMIPETGLILKRLNIKSKELGYIRENILKINIFDDETRVQAGITRFKNIFRLSPSPLWKKLTFIFSLQIIYSVLWVGYSKLVKFIRHNSRNLNPSNSGN